MHIFLFFFYSSSFSILADPTIAIPKAFRLEISCFHENIFKALIYVEFKSDGKIFERYPERRQPSRDILAWLGPNLIDGSHFEKERPKLYDQKISTTQTRRFLMPFGFFESCNHCVIFRWIIFSQTKPMWAVAAFLTSTIFIFEHNKILISLWSREVKDDLDFVCCVHL